MDLVNVDVRRSAFNVLIQLILSVFANSRVATSDEVKFRTQPFTLLSMGSRVRRIENCYLLLASLKFVTFVTTLPKVVTSSLVY